MPSRLSAIAAVAASFLGVACILCSCRSLSGGEAYRQPKPVYVTNDLAVPLLDPALLQGSLDLAQRVKGSYGGKTYFLEVYTKADSEGLEMVGLSSMGTQVMDLSYSKARGIRLSSSLGGGRFKPEYVVEDFQLAYYPFESVRAALAPYGLEFSKRGDGPEAKKVLSKGGSDILAIEELPGGGIRFANFLRGYSYELREER